jgi:hypothetical protein
MKKKAKKTASKVKKTAKPVAKKKLAAKAKKIKHVAKKAMAKKPVAKKHASKPVVKKIIKPVVKKVIQKVPPKKVVKIVSKPAPVIKVAKPRAVAPTPAKPVFKPTPKEIQKLGLKPLPKPLPSHVNDDKKPKGYYTLEYTINSSPDILFDFVSTAGGLEKWFAEKVSVKDNIFDFIWENDENKKAQLIALKEREFARFHWLDQGDKKFFEFRIQIDDLTSEVALIVSDFADTKEEFEDSRLLWNAQIHDLLHALGGAP